jgi:nicotinate-nucleotide pyrophosphorylase (carboxylating)
MESMGLSFTSSLEDGSVIDAGQEVARVIGDPVQIAKAEERIIGALSKSSGIATAARRALRLAGSGCQVVSGGWKKMPIEMKELARQAVLDGGLMIRITNRPFVYLDKNYVRILRGVEQAIKTVAPLNRATVVQLLGETGPIAEEALQAVYAGAAVIMVDTGRYDDLEKVIHALRDKGVRSEVQIAFSGKVSLDDIETLSKMDVDIVDIGYAIIDAPCLPMRFDVIKMS